MHPVRLVNAGEQDLLRSAIVSTLELRVAPSLADIDPAAWDDLVPRSMPFVSRAFLGGLEQTGCVAAQRGWVPCHLTAYRDQELVAAAPAYVKHDGMGDFSRDWGLADALRQLGSSLYPKLVVGAPFSPVTGQRFLHHDSLTQEQAVAALVALAQEVCRQNHLTTFQVLYCSAAEAQILERCGLAPRTLVQYHWHNYDYTTSEDWLARLKSKRRTQIRRESRAPGEHDLEIRTIREAELAERPRVWSQVAYSLYRTTCEKYMWGGTYLNSAFFEHLFTHLGDNVELVLARERTGSFEEPIAGAINLATDTHLYGRYWGCHREVPFLHFNVCLYHSIAECIERGIQVFEGGAGGEHKLQRGFEPRLVHCAQWFADERAHALLGDALRRDSVSRRAEVEAWHHRNGIDKKNLDRHSA